MLKYIYICICIHIYELFCSWSIFWLLSRAVDTVVMEIHSLYYLDSQLSSLLCVCMCVRQCMLSLYVARKLKPEPVRGEG